MTDNQLKLEVLRMASEFARETMYATRMSLENAWNHRVTETPFPKLPGVDVGETIKIYHKLMNAVNSK